MRINLRYASLALLFSICFSQQGYSIFLDGEGHYAIRGETRTAPGGQPDRGLFQAIDQSFRLLGEARLNDNSSMYLEFRIFDDNSTYLGDKSHPMQCEKGSDCLQSPQNVSEPGYEPYSPRIHKAYIRYATDYCLVEAGRRPRSWGTGMYLDAGDAPFSNHQSVYDGISCHINPQKSQSLGIKFGYDKLAETGARVDQIKEDTNTYGATHPNDDINQYFLAIELDDRKTTFGSGLSKHIGIYAAKISSGEVSKGGLGTDLTFVDLYFGLFLDNLAIRSEGLLRLGKTADPSSTLFGGARYDREEPAQNKMEAFALSVEAEWTISKSGTKVGPNEYGRGNETSHTAFVGIHHAPGDSQGYYYGSDEAVGIHKRNSKAKAMALNPNFSPALIMFNGRQETNDLAVDGIFDPQRIMNARLWNIGYRYQDAANGHFESQLIYGHLIESIPSEVETYYLTRESQPFGTHGTDLGIEIDFKYWKQYSKELDLGIGAAYHLVGSAWQVHKDKDPKNNILVQSYLNFNF